MASQCRRLARPLPRRRPAALVGAPVRRLSGRERGGREPLPVYPDAPSPHHSDLVSFLSYAKRRGLDEASSVYVGTRYEYTAAAALARYGFVLRRIGGASDGGIDLVGTWALPSLARPVRAIVQCKAGARRVGPQHVRELEGAFGGAPPGWRGPDGVLGLLASEGAATKGVRESLGRSRWPMMYVCCSAAGAVTQLLWNTRADEIGLEGYSAVPRRVAGRDELELMLMHNGSIAKLPPGEG